MARYYSLEQIKSAVKITHEKYGGMTEEFDLLKLLQMPTADVVPVKRGKWNCGDDMFEYAICSCCKWESGEAWEYAKKYFNYCPNCGARMEGRHADT